MQRSLLAGLAALVFGNWALFCYYSRIPQFRFADHPQLWLIPPALLVLLASGVDSTRAKFGGALASIRYAALGVIYGSLIN